MHFFKHKGKPFARIPGWSRWAVSQDGVVIGLNPWTRSWTKRKQYRQNLYWKIKLVDGGRTLSARVHRLMLLAWVGQPPEPNWLACHLDDVADNNVLDNLAWQTPTQNNIDAAKNGHRGPDRNCAKLTDMAVREIRSRALNGETTRTMAIEYGVSTSAIRNVVRGLSWDWVAN